MRFDRAFAYVNGNEGAYVNDPDDSGGPTNFGITIKTLAEWRGSPVTPEDVKRLEVKEAMVILKKLYWQPLRCDEIQNEALTIVLFDAGVLFGRSGAVKALQKALVALGAGIAVDGVMGPKTVAAVNALTGSKLIHIFSEELKSRVKSLVLARPEKQKFVKGWNSRIDKYARTNPFTDAFV